VRSGRKPDDRMGSRVSRAGVLLCVLLSLGLAGCGPKRVKVHLPVLAPADLEAVNEPDTQLDSVPEPDILPVPWPEPPRPPVRRRPPPRDDAASPAQPGNEPPAPAELSIGPLSTGGDSTPQSQQQARDAIASVDRRMVSAPSKNAGKPQMRQVRNFLDEAKKALNSGDADGAINLANKARVLMDELER
jgi:hypothetical protein